MSSSRTCTFLGPKAGGHYITNLKLRVASGLPVDIIALAIEGTRESIFEDLVLPMDDAIAADDELQAIVDEVEPVLHDALKGPDGATYYLTREWNNMIIHYNPVKFEEAGLDPPATDWTWEDFLETALTLTHGEGGDKQFGFALPYFNFGLTPWWHTNGTATLTEDWSDSNLDDPKMLESVKFVHSLVHEHGVAPSVEGTNPYALFPAGTVAMTGRRSLALRQLCLEQLSRCRYHAPGRAGKPAPPSLAPAAGAVSKSAENVPLAIELIKDLASIATDEEAVAIGTSLPARRSATENEVFNSFPANAHRFFGSLSDIKPVPSPANFAEVESIFMRHMGQIMANSVTPEQGLEAAHAELSAAMQKLAERMAS